MKQFEVPEFYRSPIIGKVKALRKAADPRKKDFSPTQLDFGTVDIVLPRHFGFCYGVENAIEIAYRALNENEGKRIFLLSQMIHNQAVNADLVDRGVRFLMDTYGKVIIPFSELTPDDIVIVPAFGTTLEIEAELAAKGLEVQRYNTTCPFVEKVWNRSAKLGDDQYTVVIHGKPMHEETRATFSHASSTGPALVVADHAEAEVLGSFISGEREWNRFDDYFANRYSTGFVPERDLQRIGVVNQTTMLASDTQGIADYLRSVMVTRYGVASIAEHFADTRDTLCYATNDNQQATMALFDQPADLAVVVGGYNSSNTSHLVELCELHMPTVFIQSEDDLLNAQTLRSFNLHKGVVEELVDILPQKNKPRIVVTSGASCPDSIVDRVIHKLVGYYKSEVSAEAVLQGLNG
ncbi:MAG: 4-hydroxy-3-methylbut-2-enyl diphosphate reductase [Flavobacteriales bacterium]